MWNDALLSVAPSGVHNLMCWLEDGASAAQCCALQLQVLTTLKPSLERVVSCAVTDLTSRPCFLSMELQSQQQSRWRAGQLHCNPASLLLHQELEQLCVAPHACPATGERVPELHIPTSCHVLCITQGCWSFREVYCSLLPLLLQVWHHVGHLLLYLS